MFAQLLRYQVAVLLACGLLARCAVVSAESFDLQLLPPVGAIESELPELKPDPGVAPEELVTTPSTIGDVTASDLIAPATEVVADDGFSWTVPSTWFTSPLWNYGAELGINGTDGNAQAFSMLAAMNAKRETDGSSLTWDIKYGKTQTAGIETQHFALFNSRWDLKFGPVWFLYNKNMLEYDEFKAFDLRLVLSAGLGYHLVKTERTTLTGRFGAGASRELGGPDDRWVPEANLGLDFEHQLSKRQKLKLTSDYFPTWEDLSDYRLVTSADWEILLDEETNLSLKLGAVDRYDSTPNGLKPNDINYYVTLLWKR